MAFGGAAVAPHAASRAFPDAVAPAAANWAACRSFPNSPAASTRWRPIRPPGCPRSGRQWSAFFGAADTLAADPISSVARSQQLADALDAPASSPQQQARRGNAIGAAIGNLTTAQDHMLNLRAGTGTRLTSLENAADTRDAGEIGLSQSLSQLRDVDYAEAASRLALQLTALDAAQQTMLRMQSLSLFDRM